MKEHKCYVPVICDGCGGWVSGDFSNPSPEAFPLFSLTYNYNPSLNLLLISGYCGARSGEPYPLPFVYGTEILDFHDIPGIAIPPDGTKVTIGIVQQYTPTGGWDKAAAPSLQVTGGKLIYVNTASYTLFCAFGSVCVQDW